jgi:hypothetical protein
MPRYGACIAFVIANNHNLQLCSGLPELDMRGHRLAASVAMAAMVPEIGRRILTNRNRNNFVG